MIEFIKKFSIVIVVIVAILFSYMLGFWIGQDTFVCKVCPPEDLDFSLFWEAWHILEEKYISLDDFDVEKMIHGAISGMVSSLGDPYTVFFNPDETKTFLENISGSFEGVGMEVGIRKGQLQVISPLEGTPAQRAGLRPGDKIIKIEDKMTLDITIEEAVSLIRGPRGTEVSLTIFRDSWESSKEFKIKRDVINIPTIEWKLIDDDIVYIKIHHFSENADTDFQRAAFKVLKTPAEKMILDLRSNPGGYLEVSERIAGWFLKSNQVIVIEDFGGKKDQEIHKARGNSNFSEFSIVVLINEGTASASEILASALRDNRGIKLIGKKTFGKGSVQQLESLTDESSLKITIANWLTPNGNHITNVGLEPDIEVELTDEDYKEDRDPQLDKAIEIIK